MLETTFRLNIIGSVTAEQVVIFELPGMDGARVQKNVRYTETGLTADVYSPASNNGDTRPAILFISGDGSPEFVAHLKDSGQYVGWGKLAAASGFVGVTFDHSSTLGLQNAPAVAAEVDTLRAYVRMHAVELGVNPHRIGIWTCSGGPPFGLRSVLRDGAPDVRCIAIYYGQVDVRLFRAQVPPAVPDSLLAEFSAAFQLRTGAPPFLLARAGRDSPLINQAMDRFFRRALELNLSVDYFNHPEGHHGFDIRDDDPRSHEIIAATLAFFGHHLNPALLTG
jgi:acetyl esterase/lipase